MLIPENLRQEDMPMMVYAVCRAVKKGDCTEEGLIKKLSVTNLCKDDKSREQVSNVVNFAKAAGVITVTAGKLITDFEDGELTTPLSFSQAMLKRIDREMSGQFCDMLRWYLWNDEKVAALESHKDIRKEMLEDSHLKQLNVSEHLTHGFLFWIEFLGIATHSTTAKNAMGNYNCSIENILIRYIETHNAELKKYGNMPAGEFFSLLEKDLFFIPLCYSETEVSYALSFALRVLNRLELIDIEDKNDGSLTWHLTRSNMFRTGNSFTNIKVR